MSFCLSFRVFLSFRLSVFPMCLTVFTCMQVCLTLYSCLLVCMFVRLFVYMCARVPLCGFCPSLQVRMSYCVCASEFYFTRFCVFILVCVLMCVFSLMFVFVSPLVPVCLTVSVLVYLTLKGCVYACVFVFSLCVFCISPCFCK